MEAMEAAMAAAAAAAAAAGMPYGDPSGGAAAMGTFGEDGSAAQRGRSPSSSSSSSSRPRKRARHSNFGAMLKGGSTISSYEAAQADPNVSADDLLEHMMAAEARAEAEPAHQRATTAASFGAGAPAPAAAPPLQRPKAAPAGPLEPIPAPPGVDPSRWKTVLCVYFADGVCRKLRAECPFAHGPEDYYGGTRGRPSSPKRMDFTAGLEVNRISKDFHIPEKQAECLITQSTKQAILDASGLQEVTLDMARRRITVLGTAVQIEKAGILLQRVTTHCHWGVNTAKIEAILRPRLSLNTARCTLSPMMTSLKGFSCSLSASKPTFTIGTDKGNQLVVRGQMLSRVHAAVEFMPSKGVVYVVDHSTNGLWLNGRRLPEKGQAKVVIWHGDELLLQDPAGGGEFGYMVKIDMY